MLFVILSLVIDYKAVKRAKILQVAHRAYLDEYNRRYAYFLGGHAGATKKEFLRYELDPSGQYGYAKIIKNMKDNGELSNWRRFSAALHLLHPTKHIPLPGSAEEYSTRQDEQMIKAVSEEIGVDVDTVTFNFD